MGAGALSQRAIGDQLTAIFVNTGMLRKNEPETVMQVFRDEQGMNLLGVDDDAAFHLLREESMRRRVSIEVCCQELEACADPVLSAISVFDRPAVRK